jgi:4-hydroxy-tetrahydrodipicolinate synthase
VADPQAGQPWAGVFPASLTMFERDGGLDLPATKRHIAWLVDQGANGVVVAGTSGEFIALDDRERLAVIEAAVDAVGGRVPVIAGTGAFSTAATIAMSRDAEAIGASGVIVILPYYQRPSLGEVRDHFAAVGRSIDIPVMAYNNPTNSAAPALSARDLADLYASGFVHAVKSTFPTVHEVHEVRSLTDDGFRTFYGSFMAPLEGLAGGAHGWISGILNVVLPDALALVDAIARSDLPAARAAWSRILPIRRLYTERQVGAVSDLAIWRAILDLRGGQGGSSRLPIRGLSREEAERVRAAIVSFGE